MYENATRKITECNQNQELLYELHNFLSFDSSSAYSDVIAGRSSTVLCGMFLYLWLTSPQTERTAFKAPPHRAISVAVAVAVR
jgi:hypothetical protein